MISDRQVKQKSIHRTRTTNYSLNQNIQNNQNLLTLNQIQTLDCLREMQRNLIKHSFDDNQTERIFIKKDENNENNKINSLISKFKENQNVNLIKKPFENKKIDKINNKNLSKKEFLKCDETKKQNNSDLSHKIFKQKNQQIELENDAHKNLKTEHKAEKFFLPFPDKKLNSHSQMKNKIFYKNLSQNEPKARKNPFFDRSGPLLLRQEGKNNIKIK